MSPHFITPGRAQLIAHCDDGDGRDATMAASVRVAVSRVWIRRCIAAGDSDKKCEALDPSCASIRNEKWTLLCTCGGVVLSAFVLSFCACYEATQCSGAGVGVRIFPPVNPFPPEEIYGSYDSKSIPPRKDFLVNIFPPGNLLPPSYGPFCNSSLPFHTDLGQEILSPPLQSVKVFPPGSQPHFWASCVGFDRFRFTQ